MPIEGELVVRVESRGGRVTAASARAERPRVADRLFPGRPAHEAAALARSLFALCGRSQAIAAESAVEAIRGVASPADQRARELRIGAETLLEHAWRLLVDAPQLAGRDPAAAPFALGRRALAPFLDASGDQVAVRDLDSVLDWSRAALLGRSPSDFLAIDTLEAFLDWTRWSSTPAASFCARLLSEDPALGASDVALLPAADGWIPGALAGAIDGDAAFDSRPTLDGTARETGPLARTASHPLLAACTAAWGRGFGARLVARLVESATLLASMGTGDPATRPPARHGAAATGDGAGIAWVETARGLLVHRVALAGESIAAYRIVAPTEWNFHPEGAFARGARNLAAVDDEALEARVRRLVASLDPCVGVRYEASHA